MWVVCAAGRSSHIPRCSLERIRFKPVGCEHGRGCLQQTLTSSSIPHRALCCSWSAIVTCNLCNGRSTAHLTTPSWSTSSGEFSRRRTSTEHIRLRCSGKQSGEDGGGSSTLACPLPRLGGRGTQSSGSGCGQWVTGGSAGTPRASRSGPAQRHGRTRWCREWRAPHMGGAHAHST